MNKELEWLDSRISLLQYREAIHLQRNVLYQELQEVSFLIPLQEMFVQPYGELETSVNQMKKHLEALISISNPASMLGLDTWKSQYLELNIFREQLYKHKERILSYEDLLSKIDSNQEKLDRNWEICPRDFTSSLCSEDGSDVLLQFRFESLTKKVVFNQK